MEHLLHSLKIGSLSLDGNLALAPLSGTSDQAFRKICRMYGAGLTVTELVSARGISRDPALSRNWRYLAFDPADNPVAIQLFGADPDDFEKAIHIIGQHPILGQCSLIDLNMGCPVAKVVREGAGAALMRTPALAARIIIRAVQAAADFGKPVTVKFRKGWDENSVNAADFARMCEEAGAAGLTIHGRTRRQMYAGRADWQIIGDVKAAVGIPVYGNGDVTSPETARSLLLTTGVDGVMIGRAARGCPWIFREIKAVLGGTAWEEPPVSEKTRAVLAHLDGLADLLGEQTACREMRKQLLYYFRGTPFGATLKNQATQVQSRVDIEFLLAEWARSQV
jgi:tRNA-dihydrouridine synthase B